MTCLDDGRQNFSIKKVKDLILRSYAKLVDSIVGGSRMYIIYLNRTKKNLC